MRYKLLGRSGLRVSEICLGAMTFGEEWGWGSTKEESEKVFNAFVEAGGNFIDTANIYTNGTSETMCGEFMAGRRERFVLATKYSLSMRRDDPNAGGNHRKNMVQSLEASLKRLKTDYIDLYWLHIWDCITPVDEVMRAMDDLVRAGKILYLGISDAPAWIVSQANTIADLKGWSPFISLQIEYSLVERTVERELLPMAEAFDLTIAAWSPLGAGVLTGKFNSVQDRPRGTRLGDSEWGNRLITERNVKISQTVAQVAQEGGWSPAQVALAWLRRPSRNVVIPIVGARRVEQLKDSLGCLNVQLNAEQLSRLDHVSKIEPGFPNTFLERTKSILFGDTYSLIDDHRHRTVT